jgi:hypothetical protein
MRRFAEEVQAVAGSTAGNHDGEDPFREHDLDALETHVSL